MRAPGRLGPPLLCLLGFLTPPLAAAQEPYLRRYAAPYAVAGGALALLVTARQIPPNPRPLLGPDFDPDATPTPPPDLAAPFALDQRISEAEIGVGLALGLSVASLLGVSDADPRWAAHDAAFGYVASQVSTLALTELAKVSVGRLRPDYAGRLAWCRAQPTDRRCVDGHAPHDGHKSFFSGHSASAFAAATWLSLQLGGRFLWRADTAAGARIGAGLGAAGLLTGASLVAASRVQDGRHHPSDVIVGGLVGAAVAGAWYFSLFDTEGTRRLDPGGLRQPLMLGAGSRF